MRGRRAQALLTASVVAVGLAACGQNDDQASGTTQVEFFQFKGEAVGTFDALIAQFEAEHPGIDIVQNNVPAADAALRTRLVKNDVPPLMTLNGNGATYGDLASAGIFRDFTSDPALADVTDSSLAVLNALGRMPGETNGVPFATNADGVIYNVDVFAELGLAPPTTWQELIQVAQQIEAAGRLPFYFTWKEAWTTLPPFNPLAQNVPEDADFWEKRQAGETTFAQGWPEVAERLLALKEYGPPDPFRFDYNTGNRAMADGEAAMYLQGIWAIPSIRSINPDVNLGTFVLPTNDDPQWNRLVSGVDVVFTMPREETPYTDEALTFIRWMMQPGASTQYITEQSHFSAVRGVVQEDPTLASLNPAFEHGNTVGFADHYIPSSIPLANMLQGFLIDGDVDAFLQDLDERYDAVMARRS
jgi:raffinose/stachyose/melibiose transport system substrate-binding protein